MTVFFKIMSDKSVRIYLRFEGTGSAQGDVGEGFQYLYPGDSFYGVTYDQFLAKGTGKMEIDPTAKP